MRYIELNGSPRQLGRQHGENCRDDIHTYYDFYCTRRHKKPESLDPSVLAYFEREFPDLVEEVRGLADGANMTYPQMVMYNHFTVVKGCTPLFFRNSDHGPLLAQTLDCEPEEQQAVVVRRVQPNNGIAFLGVSFVGTVWPGNFVSEAGICRAGVSAHHMHYRTTDGTIANLAEAHFARNAANLDELFTLMNQHCYLGKVGIRLCADGRGNAVLIEGTGETQYRTIIDADFAYSTGLYTTGNITAQDEPAYILPKYARALTIERLYYHGKIDFTVEGMKKLLSHHAEDPGSICRHNREAGFCTQSGRIMLPAEGAMLISDGRPCEHPFERFSL